MELRAVGTKAEAAVVGAEVVRRWAEQSIAERGIFRLGLSGGTGPEALFEQLAAQDLDWSRVEVYQVDERVAPDGSQDRNAELQRRTLAPVLDRVAAFHLMPVVDTDLEAAVERYGGLLRDRAGDPPVLDLVHLGIGPDGHTASLVPGDPVLDVTDRPVALTAPYQGHRRMTLTFPALDAARHRLWYVTDPAKAEVVRRLLSQDRSIPAGRVRAADSTVVAVAGVVEG